MFDPEIIAAARAKSKTSIHGISLGDDASERYPIIISKPSYVEFKRYQASLAAAGTDSEKQNHAVKTFVLNSVLHPDRDAVKAKLEEYPLWLSPLIAEISKLLGGAATAEPFIL